MAAGRLLDRPVRPRQEEELEYGKAEAEADFDEESLESQHGSGLEVFSASESAAEDEKPKDDASSDASAEDEPNDTTDLKNISFGALAQAQAALGPRVSRKRKTADIPADVEDIQERVQEKKKDAHKPKDHIARSSKHAPAVQSSRHAVSRRLDVFGASPATKTRDPRFDPLVRSSTATPRASETANKNYAFLTTYQADETLALKSQIQRSKSAEDASVLKRQLMSLEARLRRAEAVNREKEILRKHHAEEREAIRSGRKERPYYLKKSEVKREVLTQRFEGMSKKAREKTVERKRKRVKGKESKDMPRARRQRRVE